MTARGAPGRLGSPRLHLRRTDSTNTRARQLAAAGAPHGTLVTAGEQTSGRGRQGRAWSAPAGRALLCSVVVRDPARLLSLAAGAAVAELVGPEARIKWPNDVLVVGGKVGGNVGGNVGGKVAGILVEGRPQEGWAVLGVGLNVAVRQDDFPPELQGVAATLGLGPEAIEPTLARLLLGLERWISASTAEVLQAVRGRDALRGHRVRWAGGDGRADGIDAAGRLIVRTSERAHALDAGEVHLEETVTMNNDQIADYVGEHAPELDPQDVADFMAEHAKPDDQPGTQIGWAVGVLRQRGENQLGDGVSVDRVADELRRRNR